MEGVRDASFAYPEGTGVVTYDPTLVSDSAIIAAVEEATGFGLTLADPQAAPDPSP